MSALQRITVKALVQRVKVTGTGARGPQGPAGPAGTPEWGTFIGNLADQVDLDAALSGKASAAQGALADTAVQPEALAAVALSGDYNDLANLPVFGSAAATESGDYATAAQGALADTAVQPEELAAVAVTGAYADLSGTPTLGSAAAQDATAFATAAQGALADTAVQPGTLAAVATTGDYADLANLPTLGTAAAQNTTAFASAAQGATADTAVQPGDLAAVATTGAYADLSGKPTLGSAAAENTTAFATAAQGALADTAVQPAALTAAISAIAIQSKSADYTAVLTDAGTALLHPSADTTARVYTIPANASVAYPVGTVLTFINQNAAGAISIAITSDTMRLAGAGTTGTRTLAANGIATATKLTSTEWIINGTGLT